MPYIGNQPAEAYSSVTKDSFSGDGSTTAFTLSVPSTTNDLRVVVENVIQDPTVAYSVSGTTLTFTSAPPTGTNNIYAVNLGPAVQTVVPPDGVTVTDLNAYADGAVAFTANRASSDGAVIDVQKSGSSLGSIGTDYDAGIYVGGGTSALFYNQTTAGLIQPYSVTGGAVSDGVVDFGNASNRFKDLYLSGGVYLGGTGSANLLDDYEEGTWTPTQGSFSTWSSPVFSATYTKIGNVVHIKCYQTSGTVNWSAGSYMGGLPFNPIAGSVGYATDSGPTSNNGPILFWVGSVIYFQSSGSETNIVFSGTYETS
jgi:hypothetical protein